MRTDMSGLTRLTRDECMSLLTRHPVHVGRLGMTGHDGHPLILPVNYRLDGDAVVIRTEPSSVIAERAVDRPVAFEVDEVDPAWQSGWSVLIQGTAEHVTDKAELVRLRRLPLRPWAEGERTVYLRIVPATVTGRRID